jgi:hypothetical protein
MTYDNLCAAIKEAERFLEKATKLKGQNTDQWGLPSGPYVSATRRASMDLTRALAALRKD